MIANKEASEWIYMIMMLLLRNIRCYVSEGCFHELIWNPANTARASFSSFIAAQKLCLLNKNILDPNFGTISCFGGVQGKKVNDLAWEKKKIVAVFRSVAPLKKRKKTLQCQRNKCKKYAPSGLPTPPALLIRSGYFGTSTMDCLRSFKISRAPTCFEAVK